MQSIRQRILKSESDQEEKQDDSGIEHLKCFLESQSPDRKLTCGQLDVFLQNWWETKLYLKESQKLNSYSKSLSLLENQTAI